MDKKAYVIKVLELLKNERPTAEGIIVLLENGNITEDVLDALSKMIESAIETTDDKLLKNKLIQGKKIFEQIQNAEKDQRILDQVEIEKLEQIISTF